MVACPDLERSAGGPCSLQGPGEPPTLFLELVCLDLAPAHEARGETGDGCESGAEGVGNLDSQASPGANRSIEGVVRYVRDDIVGLGIGSADGVRTGDEFTVHKRATYVGRVRVVRVENETSEAVELREWRNDSERPIREGDSVTNTM